MLHGQGAMFLIWAHALHTRRNKSNSIFAISLIAVCVSALTTLARQHTGVQWSFPSLLCDGSTDDCSSPQGGIAPSPTILENPLQVLVFLAALIFYTHHREVQPQDLCHAAVGDFGTRVQWLKSFFSPSRPPRCPFVVNRPQKEGSKWTEIRWDDKWLLLGVRKIQFSICYASSASD